MYDWSDLRVALEVSRSRTLATAADRLGVDATTVGRRLAVLEKELGTPLFHRGPRGYLLNDAGRAVLPAVVEMERAALSVEGSTEHEASRPEGVVTLATSEAFARTILVPALGPLRTRLPGIDLVVVTSNRHIDLTKGEADLAVRLMRPGVPTLVARHLGELEVRPYAAIDYLARHEAPRSGLAGHDLIGYQTELRKKPEARWLMRFGARGRVTFRSDSVLALASAAVAGFGIALLPRRMGDAEPSLRAIAGLPPVPAKPLWLVCRRPMLRVARVRAVFDFLVEERRRLAGAA